MKRRTIGVVGPSIAGDFVIAALSGIYEMVQQHGYNLLVIQGTPRIIAERNLARRHISGWIVVVDADGIEDLAATTPAVLVGATVADGRFPVVMPDNRHGIRELMDHLLGHGHERFGFVGNLTNQDMRERFDTFTAVLAERHLPCEPSRVYDIPGYSAAETEAAMRRFLATPLTATALVVAADEHARGVISALVAAGYRVPEDIAVVGFDDIATAQHMHPPLTTVRQRPDELGCEAARILIGMIEGQPPAPAVTAMPTTLVQRRSCGCQQADEHIRELAASRIIPGADWQAALSRHVLRIIYHPQQLPADAAPARSWPGLASLLDELAAIIAGEPAAAEADLAQTWAEAVALNGSVDTLYAVQQALEAFAADDSAANAATHARLSALWDRSRLALLNARLDVEYQQRLDLERLVTSSYHISLVLTAEHMELATLLDWMAYTSIYAGCLALWPAHDTASHSQLRIDSVYWRGDQPPIAKGQTYAPAEFPPPALLEHPTNAEQANYAVVLPITTAKRDWGVLALNDPQTDLLSTTMSTMSMWLTILGAALDRSALEDSLQAEREMLRSAYERERALANTVRELGCSLIPILPGVALVPLVGMIDQRRAQQIVEVVLNGVSGSPTELVVIDITGVPVVDTQVIGTLVQTATAATLLGVQVALVGIRPEVAQSIIGLGVDLSAMHTFPSLADALEQFSRRRARSR